MRKARAEARSFAEEHRLPFQPKKDTRRVATLFPRGVHPYARGHANLLPFEGCLTLIDQVSDRPVGKSNGHCVVMTRRTASMALPGLLGMALNYKTTWDGHDPQRKCGVITRAEILDGRILVRGYVYGLDFPDVVAAIANPSLDLGMSYEVEDARVKDPREAVWTLTRATFVGAAILLRHKAAYRQTSIRLAA